MIKNIYLANVLEGFYKNYLALAPKKRDYWIKYDQLESSRVLFYAGDQKLLVTQKPINPRHLSFIKKLLNWQEVVNLIPSHSSWSLSLDILQDKKLLEELKKVIWQNPKIALIPYQATPQFYQLIKYLRKIGLSFTTPESMPSENKFIQNYANSKRGFRHLWSESVDPQNFGVNIPEGFIANDKEEACEASWWFWQQKRSFVLKDNRSTQGSGVLLNPYGSLPTTKKEFFNLLLEKITGKIWGAGIIICEELIEPDEQVLGGSPSIEFLINENGKTIPTYGCEQILEADKKTFRGIYIHPQVMTNKHVKAAFAGGLAFGNKLASLGYRGFFDVDLVISKNDKVYAVESNLRRTGGTHVHDLATSILGKKYLEKFYVANEDVILPHLEKLTFEQCQKTLSDLLFTKQNSTGIILCIPDLLPMNVLNIVYISRSPKQDQFFRQEVKKRLEKLSQGV